MIQPDNVGPKAGANPITIPDMPMAEPRFSGGKIDNMIFCKSGIEIPTPAACTKRPINNVEKFGAAKQAIVPARKMLIAVK